MLNELEIPKTFSMNDKTQNIHIMEFSDHVVKKQKIEYFTHLIRIAKADDVISNAELELLKRIGKRIGFSEPEIVVLIETTGKSDYIPPYELSERFAQVYDVVKMALADGIIEHNSMRLVNSFAVKSGFVENEIPVLLVLIIAGIRQGKDEDELFENYKIRRKH